MVQASTPLQAVLKDYGSLETEVQETVTDLFGEICALCTSPCCTPDICEESCDSAFLRALRASSQPDVTFCERFGWLSERGCMLQCGRPPVCYGFFCNEIVNSLSGHDRETIRVLGRLVSWVGERAIGSQHLVEPTDDSALSRVKIDRVISRVDIAREALRGVRSALLDGSVSEESRRAMRRILD